MRLRWLSVVAGLGLVACSFDGGGVEPDGTQPNPDGGADAEQCTPGCDGDVLVTCTSGNEERTPCALGCTATPQPHCALLNPSNGAEAEHLDMVPVTGDLVIPAGATYRIDTDDGEIRTSASVLVRAATPGGGRDEETGTNFELVGNGIVVLAVDSLVIEPGATLSGIGSKALVILARGEIRVLGTIDFSAGCNPINPTCGGPGGGVGAQGTGSASGCAAGGNGVGDETDIGDAIDESGGGGGGLGAAGGKGGDGEGGSPSGGQGGTPATACPGATLVPLLGGSGGGAGGVGGGSGGRGGGGGGAIQLTSYVSVTIGAPDSGGTLALINVNGAGGLHSIIDTEGGGGGGSGGGILLEAPSVVVTARAILVANGGGGGSGQIIEERGNGKKGTLTTEQAQGGDDDRGAGGGGDGGARNGAAQPGGGDTDGGGGGGGSVGIIRVNGRAVMTSGAVISPAHTVGPAPTE